MQAPGYHALILAFFLACGVPMVLNTSFNRESPSQPAIANQPYQCIEASICAMFQPHSMHSSQLDTIPL